MAEDIFRVSGPGDYAVIGHDVTHVDFSSNRARVSTSIGLWIFGAQDILAETRKYPGLLLADEKTEKLMPMPMQLRTGRIVIEGPRQPELCGLDPSVGEGVGPDEAIVLTRLGVLWAVVDRLIAWRSEAELTSKEVR